MAAVRGEVLDRPPFAVWRHFEDQEQPGRARDLPETLVAFVRRHELDLLKYNPRARYHGEPWDFAWPDRPVDLSHPTFAEMLEGLRLARAALGDLPIVMTIFTPLAICGGPTGDAVLRAMAEDPGRLESALEIVSETFAHFAAACVDAGADGIFLATVTFGSRDRISDADYARFGRPYDVRLLEAVASAPLNVLHVCGARARVLDLADYPHVVAVSWNVHGEGNPALGEVRGSAVVGGISDAALLDADLRRVRGEVRSALTETAGRGWIAAGGCTIPTTSRPENIDATRLALESVRTP